MKKKFALVNDVLSSVYLSVTTDLAVEKGENVLVFSLGIFKIMKKVFAHFLRGRDKPISDCSAKG